MTDRVLAVGLGAALATVMFSPGLSRRPDHFRRLCRHPGAAEVALGLQVVALPLEAYAIVRMADLDVA